MTKCTCGFDNPYHFLICEQCGKTLPEFNQTQFLKLAGVDNPNPNPKQPTNPLSSIYGEKPIPDIKINVRDA